MLAEVTLGFGDRTSFPEVSYATALDYFIVLCMFFVFASIIEFACINFMERRANKRRKKIEEFKKKLKEDPDHQATVRHTFFTISLIIF